MASTSSGRVTMLVRSAESAERALAAVEKASRRIPGANPSRVTTTMEIGELAGDPACWSRRWSKTPGPGRSLRRGCRGRPGRRSGDHDLSLSITKLGEDCGAPDRVYGLHVFNPVPAMKLVELVFPNASPKRLPNAPTTGATSSRRPRSRFPTPPASQSTGCSSLYLFDAVRYQERTAWKPRQSINV